MRVVIGTKISTQPEYIVATSYLYWLKISFPSCEAMFPFLQSTFFLSFDPYFFGTLQIIKSLKEAVILLIRRRIGVFLYEKKISISRFAFCHDRTCSVCLGL